jgi:glutamate racemase
VSSGPIGVFDSGVGGLGVLAEIRALLPHHDLIYVADQAFAPYGERDLATVRHRAFAIAGFLIEAGVTLVVVACNSASAAALHELRDRFPDTPFVGMEPAVKPAAGATKRGTIGVLATEATFQGELFASVVDRHARDVAVVARACPGLAAAIEDGDDVDGLVRRFTSDVVGRGADTIVLGCTHYSFVSDQIRSIAGEGIRVIDPAPAVARQVARLSGTGSAASDGATTYLTTGDADRFSDQIERLTGTHGGTTTVDIGEPQTGIVTVVHGDITMQDVDAIVNAANSHLSHGGGVAAAIASAGSPVVDAESRVWIDEHGPIPPGGAAVTSAGTMPAEYVVHVVGPVFRDGQDNEALLRWAVDAALETATGLGARTVAMPAISAGIYGYPPAEACRIIAEEATSWLDAGGDLDEIRLVAYGDTIADHFQTALRTQGS